MDAKQKACIAYILVASEKSSVSSVYDYSLGTFSTYSNTGSDGNFQVFDFARNCHVMGHLSGLYDFGTNSYISISKNHGDFTIYDFSSNSYFTGSLSGNVVTVYDFQGSMNVYTVQ